VAQSTATISECRDEGYHTKRLRVLPATTSEVKSGISINDLKALLSLYGITDEEQTDELIALARAARQSPWWSRYRDVAPTTLLELIDHAPRAGQGT